MSFDCVFDVLYVYWQSNIQCLKWKETIYGFSVLAVSTDKRA